MASDSPFVLMADGAGYNGCPCLSNMVFAWAELLHRNHTRTAPVPEVVFQRLASKLDMPSATEAYEVEYTVM